MPQQRSSYRVNLALELQYTDAKHVDESRKHGADSSFRRPVWENAHALDMSAGGLRMAVVHSLPVGQDIYVRFQLPNNFLSKLKTNAQEEEVSPFGTRLRTVEVAPKPFPPLELRARILHVEQNVKSRRFVTNVKFLQLADGDIDILYRFINLWQRNELNERPLKGK